MGPINLNDNLNLNIGHTESTDNTERIRTRIARIERITYGSWFMVNGSRLMVYGSRLMISLCQRISAKQTIQQFGEIFINSNSWRKMSIKPSLIKCLVKTV